MRQLKSRHSLKTAMFTGWLLFSLAACAGNAPKPVNVGPVPTANAAGTSTDSGPSQQTVQGSNAGGGAGTGQNGGSSTLSNHAGENGSMNPGSSQTGATGTQGQLGAGTSNGSSGGGSGGSGGQGGPAACTSNYGLGYGDPYQISGQGGWIAKNSSDYSVECSISTPPCTANGGLGYGSKYAHGALWLAKGDTTYADATVCIITSLTGTKG